MHEARYTQLDAPSPVSVEYKTNERTRIEYAEVTIRVNPRIESNPDTNTQNWLVDENVYWERVCDLDLDAVNANPEAYLHYLPVHYREAKKQEAQDMLDALRNNGSVVPVPSFRTDAAVYNRTSDKAMFSAALARGNGLPGYELASGEMVAPLTHEQMQAIYDDVAAAEIAWQLGKQTCWATIDAATDEQAVKDALAAYKEQLDAYTLHS